MALEILGNGDPWLGLVGLEAVVAKALPVLETLVVENQEERRVRRCVVGVGLVRRGWVR